MRFKAFRLLLSVIILIQSNVNAQPNKQKNTVSFYFENIGDQSALLNGTKYLGYPNYFKEGHPFYNTDALQQGQLVYDHVQFENVNFHYDLVQDAIIFQDSIHRIQLINEKVEKFTILDKIFIRIEKDSHNNVLQSSGFYNLQYDGQVKFIVKYIKTKKEAIVNTNELLGRFEPSIIYYIKRKNQYYSINRKKDLLNLFRDKKGKITSYVKSLGFNYRADPENYILKVASYYDQL
jgi:hypothetical protein